MFVLFCMDYYVFFLMYPIILKRIRELVVLFLLSNGCLVTINVLWHFLKVPWVCLQFVFVVFPNHTDLFF